MCIYNQFLYKEREIKADCGSVDMLIPDPNPYHEVCSHLPQVKKKNKQSQAQETSYTSTTD